MLNTHNGLTIRRIEEKNDSSGMLFFFDSFFLFLSLKCHLESRSITETKDSGPTTIDRKKLKRFRDLRKTRKSNFPMKE
jgi:hypothetical protein